MSTTATLSRPSSVKFVQQTFQWEATSASASNGACVLSFPKKSRSLPTPPRESSRVGRCVQAGGLMERVLSKYGISPEEFRQAVEELRASRGIRGLD